ncbi:protein of unassigned function [Methylobacterium oryzae CBMB20]|uniref:Protein of unassigned function n=1 Tax=Methylobacterium oryzae CBMB20 TaxID=693986 RepID=A0A089NK72_9HYPH|nr:protein of unassigned function [Methylobacterium oryzae CBMB20]
MPASPSPYSVYFNVVRSGGEQSPLGPLTFGELERNRRTSAFSGL